ncbi:hypothetical protein EF847_21475 [Actinobacteria bacterium YIM 96077]|uniref:Uncharacterized protein n=1 Tax=Phytoactinopolyspora halophila TaxID=1981511 RepID=A0A329QT71_9ACTN|nr:hypothetical protein EF847_21475 [Actinobacteria bacterium YIM 96077]RAW15477.1 hypothetical protein DPM12_08705 [Phytoactinopolyspora halophila]
MTFAAVAVAGAVLWYAIDRRREEIPTFALVLASGVPTLLLAAAALFAFAGDEPARDLVALARVLAVAAAVPGGALVATTFLRLTDRVRKGHGWTDAPTYPESPAPPFSLGTSVVSPAPPPPPPPPPHTAASAPATTRPRSRAADPDTLRGGTTIGALERAAVVITLLSGWPEGLALILAVKGFGRYPELRRPSAPERFIIGTFASILWAAGVAGVVVLLRG